MTQAQGFFARRREVKSEMSSRARIFAAQDCKAVISVPPQPAMTPKRILLIHEDRLLANLFSDKLENAGLPWRTRPRWRDGAEDGRSESAGCGRDGPRCAGPGYCPNWSRNCTPSAANSRCRSSCCPNRPSFCGSGAGGRGDRTGSRAEPGWRHREALQTALKLDKGSVLSKGVAVRADDNWLKMSLNAAPEVLTDLRRTLHEISREGKAANAPRSFISESMVLRSKWRCSGRGRCTMLPGRSKRWLLISPSFPSRSTPPCCARSSQALDFLATLLPETVPQQIERPRLRAGARRG